MLSGHDWPQLALLPGALNRHNQYFGPYRMATRCASRFRCCSGCSPAHLRRQCIRQPLAPCLLHQIKRCSAPCVGLIDAASYQADGAARRVLLGKHSELIDDLSAQMQAAAEALAFEQAATLRDQIQALARVQERQFVQQQRPRSWIAT